MTRAPEITPEAVEKPSEMVQIALELYTSVDYQLNKRVGIGPVQTAYCATTSTRQDSLVPPREQYEGTQGEGMMGYNVKRKSRADLFAIQHALGMLRAAVGRHSSDSLRFTSVTIFSEMRDNVQQVNHHRKGSPGSLWEIESSDTRKMMKNILSGVRRLTRHGIEVSIKFGNTGEAVERARELASAKGGKKFMRERRRKQREEKTSRKKRAKDKEPLEEISSGNEGSCSASDIQE